MLFSPLSLLHSEPISSGLVIHNHILWNYRGSIITVMDVVKRLEQYGQNIKGFDKLEAAQKLEFYQQNWRGALQELMDQELIYQDAIDHNMIITDAEGRDQLVKMYGEKYITHIDQIGMTMKEALDMVKKEMLIQRMVYFRVHYQARNAITPSIVAQKYKELCQQQPETDIWSYQTLTFKGPTQAAYELARQWKEKLVAGATPEECKTLTQEGVTSTISRLNQQSSLNLNQKYLEVLQKIQEQSWSDPICFKEDDKEGLVRLFFLKEKTHLALPAFSKIRQQIEDEIFQTAVAEENQRYIVKLRRQLEQEHGQSLQQVFNPTSLLFSLK